MLTPASADFFPSAALQVGPESPGDLPRKGGLKGDAGGHHAYIFLRRKGQLGSL